MEVTQSRIYTALSVIGGILSVLVLALVFEIEPWWK
jgi:hypothetical protein